MIETSFIKELRQLFAQRYSKIVVLNIEVVEFSGNIFGEVTFLIKSKAYSQTFTRKEL